MNISISSRSAIAAVILIVVIIAAVFLYKKSQEEKKSYSVVYLTTGEVYVGQLSTFPRFKLDNAYLLQTVKDVADAAKSNLQLTPLSEAVWSPKTLLLNEKNVVFYGPLKDDSKALEAIKKNGE